MCAVPNYTRDVNVLNAENHPFPLFTFTPKAVVVSTQLKLQYAAIVAFLDFVV